MVYDAAMGATLLYGGNTYDALYGDTWAFSKTTGWTQLTPAVSPPPLQGASMAYDPTSQTVVLFGGSLTRIPAGSGTDSDETWTWDGVTWTQQFPSVSPSARSWNATNGMVFDSQLGKVVLFGGYTARFGMMDDTWEWDGRTKTWTQQFPTDSPSERVATLAYDEITNTVMLFGGWTNGIDYDDTWDGKTQTWGQQYDPTRPSTGSAPMAYDEATSTVVLYGGPANNPSEVETWTYSGVSKSWTQQSPVHSPPALQQGSMAYDRAIGSVVYFGGFIGGWQDTQNQTWVWNGSDWTQLHPATVPGNRYDFAMDYDPINDVIFMFGGYSTGPALGDTWLLQLQP